MNNEKNSLPINTIITTTTTTTTTKYHIFTCAVKKRTPNLFAVKEKLKSQYEDQYFLYPETERREKILNLWTPFDKLFADQQSWLRSFDQCIYVKFLYNTICMYVCRTYSCLGLFKHKHNIFVSIVYQMYLLWPLRPNKNYKNKKKTLQIYSIWRVSQHFHKISQYNTCIRLLFYSCTVETIKTRCLISGK